MAETVVVMAALPFVFEGAKPVTVPRVPPLRDGDQVVRLSQAEIDEALSDPDVAEAVERTIAEVLAKRIAARGVVFVRGH